MGVGESLVCVFLLLLDAAAHVPLGMCMCVSVCVRVCV